MKRFALAGLTLVLMATMLAMGCGEGNGGGAQPTATQQPTQPPATEVENPAATASSLDFTVEGESEGIGTFTYRYRARNIGTSDLDFRYDVSMQGMDVAYILKGSTQEGWAYNGQEWIEFSQTFPNWDAYWNAYYSGWESYHASLAEGWAGQGTWTYTVPGVGSVTYKNIEINPALPDSLFQPD
jgi:hypothetical protein